MIGPKVTQPPGNGRDAVQIAQQFADGGWSVVPIAARSKAPRIDGWQNLRIDADAVDEFFSPGDNIGVLLGEPSGMLVDVDLDHPLAIELADEFLPETECEFGRASKPRSHRLYRVSGDIATHKRQAGRPHGMLVELRSTGCQTVFPGSIHEEGEPIEWHTNGEPTSLDPAELRRTVDTLADEVERRLGIQKPTSDGRAYRLPAEPERIASPTAIARCRAYIAKMPRAVSGCGGHNATLEAAAVAYRFGLSDADAATVLDEYNGRCEPPWSPKELRHKLDDARKLVSEAGEFGGMLRNVASQNGQHLNSGGGDEPHRTGDKQDRRERYKIETMTSVEFDGGDFSPVWLVDDFIVANEPMVIAAGLKTMKTMLSVCIALSLALGETLFGMFRVQRPVRVLLFSGESGWGTLQSAARRMADSMGYTLADAGNLLWSKSLPTIGHLEHIDELRRVIAELAIEVIILDPLYFCLPGQDAGNLMIMGERLRSLSIVCEELGVTLIVVHHINKTTANLYDPPKLSDVSWSGTAEWARQWVLLSRRSPYKAGSGSHELWMEIGGSAGHSSQWGADIFEGVHPDRTWQIELRRPEEIRDADAGGKQAAKEAERLKKLARDVKSLVDAAAKFPGGETKSVLRIEAGLNSGGVNKALAIALGRGDHVDCDVFKSGKKTPIKGYKLAPEPAQA